MEPFIFGSEREEKLTRALVEAVKEEFIFAHEKWGEDVPEVDWRDYLGELWPRFRFILVQEGIIKHA